jgi:deoxyribodipyrimidine photo-lyase
MADCILSREKVKARRRKFFVSPVPEIRIRRVNGAAAKGAGQYVLYWMIASRRLRYNFAPDRVLGHSRELGKPLAIFEALRAGYPWASDRLHRFVLDGMAENARFCEARGARYLAYVEPKAGAGKGLLRALAEEACVVVTDEFPCFFLPKMVASAGKQLSVLLEAVDSNGLLLLRATEQVFQRAFDFRRFLQKELPEYLRDFPHADPLAKAKVAEAPKYYRIGRWLPKSCFQAKRMRWHGCRSIIR